MIILKKMFPNIQKIVIFSTIPILLTLILYIYIDFSKTLTHLSQSVIDKTINKTEAQINTFFTPVKDNLRITKDRLELFDSIQLNKYEMNKYFISYLKNTKQSSSLLIANSLGEEYMLLQEDSTWQNRTTVVKGGIKIVERSRFNYKQNIGLEEAWRQEGDLLNDPTKKQWFINAVNNKDDELSWTDLYLFNTTKDIGTTISLSWETKQNNVNLTYVIAYDIMLKDLSSYISNLKISKNGKIVIFSEKGKIIGLSREVNNEEYNKENILKLVSQINIPYLKEAFNKWEEDGELFNTPYFYMLDGKKWWAEVRKFKLNSKRSISIAVMVPEDDFLSEINSTKNIILISFGLIMILYMLVVRGYNEKRKTNQVLKYQKREITDANKELNQKNEEITSQRDKIERQRDIVLEQKEEIEEIHHEISQSIDYATRLQSAILPEEKILRENLSDYFVLFKPKDKVSGDFYWWSQQGDKTIVIAADSTGHGVPGAFMSMLGSSFLREIVEKQSLTNTAAILNKLREEVVKALKQTGEAGTQKDGMDMAIISIDNKTNIVQFSGANNPLYIVKRGELKVGGEMLDTIKEFEHDESSVFKLYELRPDKMPIAIYEKMDNFSTHEIQLEKGDQLYMFSDGYADQFGGAKGKKFKYKPFKRLLLENTDKAMQEQKEILNQAFKTWKGDLEQIDDVLVLGVKI